MKERRFGARLTADGISFRIWAPAAKRVELVLDRRIEMQRDEGGWFSATINSLKAGTTYKFRIDDELDVPDPASAFQPRDVSGPSEVIDHDSFDWRATDWRGRPWHEAVVLEAHVGAFTRQGTFAAMIDRLDHLVETGVTALELMPLGDFAGKRNWGYDGVLWYAPDSAYGRPEELKALIDEAHRRGLMMFLDVVYNHFGPEGNYLARYAPQFFTAAQTPWGSAIDYRVEEVRAFAIENALYWLRDYRLDGLRLDAVHALAEHGEPSLLHELSVAVGDFANASGRHIHLVLENDDNASDLLDPGTNPSRGKYRAQWNDDYHHAWHVLLTGESRGYYRDYQRSARHDIARALASGFVYQGEASAHRGGKQRGLPSSHLAPTAFVNFLQNHDQIGNRPLGDRLGAIADRKAIEAALAITLLMPSVPMLFMGEEWGATTPFPFFCGFEGALAEAVRNGRRREFDWAYARYGNEIPDPLDPATFAAAKLDWDGRAGAAEDRLTLIRKLLSVRRREITPRLAEVGFGSAEAASEGLLTAHWRMPDGKTLRLTANLSDSSIRRSSDTTGAAIWGGEAGERLAPWSVLWRLGG